MSPQGTVASTAVAVKVDELMENTMRSNWEPAELAGKRGWLIKGEDSPDGVFDGKRMDASDALPLSRDRVVGQVTNGARLPPSHGGGGMIKEAMGGAVFFRTRNDEEVGDALDLEWQGNAVGVTGIYGDTRIVWSGTYFIYQFHDERGAGLLPIDCRPP